MLSRVFMLIRPNTEPGKGDLNSLLSLWKHGPLGFAPGGVLSPKAGTGLLSWATSHLQKGELHGDMSVCNGDEILG